MDLRVGTLYYNVWFIILKKIYIFIFLKPKFIFLLSWLTLIMKHLRLLNFSVFFIILKKYLEDFSFKNVFLNNNKTIQINQPTHLLAKVLSAPKMYVKYKPEIIKKTFNPWA